MDEECPECEECETGVPAWVMTFADLMTLLMCFFVLLLSFSQMDAQKFEAMAGSMSQAFGVQREIRADAIPMADTIIASEFSPGEPKPTPIKVIQQQTLEAVKKNPEAIQPVTENVANVVSELVENLEDEIKEGLLEIVIKDEQLLIRINEQGSFGSGHAKLQKSFKPALSKLAKVLDSSKGNISVAGHTDNIPIRTGQFPSNWVLSAARAASVVHHLTHSGLKDKSRIQIRAYADTHPLVDNKSSANRAQNRRIEINIDTGVGSSDQDPESIDENKDINHD